MELQRDHSQDFASLRNNPTVEYRQLGGSGFMEPALRFGTGTFGGSSVGWNLTGAQVAKLDAARVVTPV